MKRDLEQDLDKSQGAIYGTCLALINIQELYGPDYQEEKKVLIDVLHSLKKKHDALFAIRAEGLPRE